jgi:hypothetical protein
MRLKTVSIQTAPGIVESWEKFILLAFYIDCLKLGILHSKLAVLSTVVNLQTSCRAVCGFTYLTLGEEKFTNRASLRNSGARIWHYVSWVCSADPHAKPELTPNAVVHLYKLATSRTISDTCERGSGTPGSTAGHVSKRCMVIAHFLAKYSKESGV